MQRPTAGDNLMPTQKYLVMLRNVPGKQEPPTPAQMKDMYGAFGAWQAKFASNIADMGGKLRPGGKVVTESQVMDGPFAETKEVVAGFMVIAAASYEQAIEVARQCPGVMRPGTSIEIREIATSA
jgi:hypothetical protein